MPSQYEDTTVDSLDVANYSDEQLADIAENDTRSTAQDKAKAEIQRRVDEKAASEDEAGEGASAPSEPETRTAQQAAEDVSYVKDEDTGKEYAQVPVRDSAGRQSETAAEDLGAGQVQARVDAATIAGVTTGEHDPSKVSPPSREHTVSGVTGNSALQDLADEG